MTPRRPLVAIAAFAALAACGSGDSGGAIVAPEGGAPTSSTTSTTAPANPDPRPAVHVVELTVVDGQPEGGAADVDIELGEMVSIQVTSDTVDEAHLHGYDRFADVGPDTLGEITFTADIPGQFEIELENNGVLLANLIVE